MVHSRLEITDFGEKLADSLLLDVGVVFVGEPLEVLFFDLLCVQLLVVIVEWSRVALLVQELLLFLDRLQ